MAGGEPDAPATGGGAPDAPAGPDGGAPDEPDTDTGSALEDMTDDELEGALETAGEAGDIDQLTAVADEMNRRQESGAQTDDEQLDLYERLISEGMNDERAVEEAFGVPIERQRRENAIHMLRSQSYVGRGFDELARASYRDYVADLRARAEADPDVGQAIITDKAFQAGIDVNKFFSGPDSYVRKNASEELLRWLDENGRMTFEEWKAQLLGDAGGARSARLERIGRQDYYR